MSPSSLGRFLKWRDSQNWPRRSDDCLPDQFSEENIDEFWNLLEKINRREELDWRPMGVPYEECAAEVLFFRSPYRIETHARNVETLLDAERPEDSMKVVEALLRHRSLGLL